MEWKIIVGQICLTIVAVACIITGTDHGLAYTALGALGASIGIPAVLEAKKSDAS